MLWNIFFGENEFCAPFNKWIYACNMIFDIKKFKLKFLKQQNCNILVWPQLKNKHECKYLTDLRKKYIHGISFFSPNRQLVYDTSLSGRSWPSKKFLVRYTVYVLWCIKYMRADVHFNLSISISKKYPKFSQIYRKRELQWMNHYCLRYIHVGI